MKKQRLKDCNKACQEFADEPESKGARCFREIKERLCSKKRRYGTTTTLMSAEEIEEVADGIFDDRTLAKPNAKGNLRLIGQLARLIKENNGKNHKR